VELDFSAQERTVRRPKTNAGGKTEKLPEKEEMFFTVCRFDFSARIALPGGGFKTVLIELQKAKLASDIMRFRRYLGLHYENSGNSYEGGRRARQIYCIFILGHDIGIPDTPVVTVNYEAKDHATQKALTGANEFIRSLHHRSWIVQMEQLKRRRSTDLEKLLSIFDQENRTKNYHILNIDEDDLPESYRPIIRRLRMAYESEDVQTEMQMEDDYMQELIDKERLIGEKEKIIEEQEKALREKDKDIEELKRQLEEMRKQK
jgi:hypothetical protein